MKRNKDNFFNNLIFDKKNQKISFLVIELFKLKFIYSIIYVLYVKLQPKRPPIQTL